LEKTSLKKRPRVAIIGAGFGGLWAARALAKASADVVVIDRNRVMVLINWAWDYLLYERAVRYVFPSKMPAGSQSCSCANEPEIAPR